MNVQSQNAHIAAHFNSLPGITAFERAAAALTATTATAAIGAALLACFHSASPTEWLTPTPEVLSEVARCEQLAGRHAQTACKQQFVTAQLTRSPTSFQVARR